jgi:hypothetical protein
MPPALLARHCHPRPLLWAKLRPKICSAGLGPPAPGMSPVACLRRHACPVLSSSGQRHQPAWLLQNVQQCVPEGRSALGPTKPTAHRIPLPVDNKWLLDFTSHFLQRLRLLQSLAPRCAACLSVPTNYTTVCSTHTAASAATVSFVQPKRTGASGQSATHARKGKKKAKILL